MHVSEVSDPELGSGILTTIDNAGVFVREIQKGREGIVAFYLFKMSPS